MNNLINIENRDGQLLVSSREVAERFEKEHKHVMESIRNLIDENSTVKNMMFENIYISNRGKEYPEYLLTKNGFSLLAMGFTGKKALEWKLKYIAAFDEMEKTLNTLSNIYPIILNEISELISNKLDKKTVEIEESIDIKVNSRLEDLKEYYKPTHAAKIGLCNYIKKRLGVDGPSREYELVKRRVLLMLNADKWQDVSFETLLDSMNIIDNSIEVIKATRVTRQVSLFE